MTTLEQIAREFCDLMPYEKVTPDSYAGRVLTMLERVAAEALASERQAHEQTKRGLGDARRRERERCAKVCDAMVVGGRAWNHEQQIAAEALFAAAKNIRVLPDEEP